MKQLCKLVTGDFTTDCLHAHDKATRAAFARADAGEDPVRHPKKHHTQRIRCWLWKSAAAGLVYIYTVRSYHTRAAGTHR
ncbi:MAG: hypothetical protein Q9187_002545 [Circinaria calcarea]